MSPCDIFVPYLGVIVVDEESHEGEKNLILSCGELCLDG